MICQFYHLLQIMMFSLLLLFLMTIQKVDEVTIQPVQQVQEQPVKVIGADRAWRTERPINQRTQVVNTYLDWIRAIKTTQAIPDVTLTDVTWYTFTKTGNYLFENVDSIIIPINWTYIINAVFDWNDALTQGIHYVTINGTPELIQVWDNMSAFQNIFITSVENLSKWDIIAVEVFQESWSSKNVTVTLTLTKIS